MGRLGCSAQSAGFDVGWQGGKPGVTQIWSEQEKTFISKSEGWHKMQQCLMKCPRGGTVVRAGRMVGGERIKLKS